MAHKPCGLISAVPAALQPEWVSNLERLTKVFRPAALILIGLHSSAARLVAEAGPLEFAILFADAAAEARRDGANGVYFSNPGSDIAGTRAELGSASVIGASCGLSRHAAMENAEGGADFVAFDASGSEKWDEASELSLWWDEITGIPAALACGRFRPSRDILSQTRPDFLIVEETGKAAESLTFAIEIGLQSQT
jgi:thiamine-phosphate pyrophosphorylase